MVIGAGGDRDGENKGDGEKHEGEKSGMAASVAAAAATTTTATAAAELQHMPGTPSHLPACDMATPMIGPPFERVALSLHV